MRTTATVATALAVSWPLHALGQTLTLSDARARAQRVAPTLELARTQHDIAQAEVMAAGALVNPSLSLAASTRTFELGTGLAVPVPVFGQRGKAIDAARADADAVAMEQEVAAVDARWSATLAWLDLWAAQERAQLVALASEEAQRLRDIARERFEAGSAPKLDVIRATADHARARADAAETRQVVDAAAARLLPWIGGELAALPRATGTPAPPEALPALDALTGRTQAHPLLRRDRAQIAAAGAHVALEERLRVPVPSAEVMVEHRDRTDEKRTNIIGGVSIDLPVLSLRGGEIARARGQRSLAELTAAWDERQLLAQLRDAYTTTTAAAARTRSLRGEVLPAMEEVWKLTEESYREGRVDMVRLLEAQHAVLDARLAVLEASLSWCRAVAELERSAGVSLYAH